MSSLSKKLISNFLCHAMLLYSYTYTLYKKVKKLKILKENYNNVRSDFYYTKQDPRRTKNSAPSP